MPRHIAHPLHIGVRRVKGIPTSAETSRSHLEDGTHVSAATSRRRSCDSGLVRMTHAPDGSILDVGRKTRTIPPAIRSALDHRDEGYRFPGCGLKFCDAHHIEHWADGGETSLDNLLNLCRFHHTQLHRGCFHIHIEPPTEPQAESIVVFSSPSGEHIETRVFPQFPAQVAATAEAAIKAMAPQVDATTCIPSWFGESCDYGVAVEALLRRDGQFC